MKVKMISRNPDNYVRETKLQQHKSELNLSSKACNFNSAYFQCPETTIHRCIHWKVPGNMYGR